MQIKAGICSETGKRSRNEDYVAVMRGEPGFGVVAALADGVGGHLGGRVAAESSVRGFIDGYLGQNPLLGVRVAAGRALDPLNRWVHAIGRSDPSLEGMACTFTALILRGRHAHVVHVGDSRLYRLRDGVLHRLTTDHVLDQRGLSHMLTRAVGLDEDLAIAWDVSPVHQADRFLLCSDGVHGTLRDCQILALLDRGDCEAASQALVRAALDAGGTDNATACVLEVASLPPPDQGDIETALSGLPLAGEMREGQAIDGFRLERLLSDGRDFRVFLARDETRPELPHVPKLPCVLKLPRSGSAGDLAGQVQASQALAREAWIGSRVHSPWLGEAIEVPLERRSALYLAMPFYAGETLERRLRRPPRLSLADGLGIGIRLGRAVAALHRAGVIHRDIKPENVILTGGGGGGSGGLRLIDLGVARLPRLEAADASRPPGTPPGTASYRAPEMLAGTEAGSEATDQFALGVTLFRAFTGAYPYGEVEPFSHPRFGTPASLMKARPDLPPWLDLILSRAVAVSPEARFGDVIEFIFALEHGAERAAGAPPSARPWFERDPLRAWKTLCAGLALLLLLALALA